MLWTALLSFSSSTEIVADCSSKSTKGTKHRDVRKFRRRKASILGVPFIWERRFFMCCKYSSIFFAISLLWEGATDSEINYENKVILSRLTIRGRWLGRMRWEGTYQIAQIWRQSNAFAHQVWKEKGENGEWDFGTEEIQNFKIIK